MTDLIKFIEGLVGNIKRIFYQIPKPANVDYNFNGTITLAKGMDIEVEKELNGQVPSTIEILCAQNFVLKYGFKKVANKTWPDTLVAGSWHKWNNRAYTALRIEPVANAVTKIIISGVDPKG